MPTDLRLRNIHVFPNEESFNGNLQSVAEGDICLVPLGQDFVPTAGSRGVLKGYQSAWTSTTDLILTKDSEEGIYHTSGNITVNDGAAGEEWTKTVFVGVGVSVTKGANWLWYSGEVPEIKANSLLVFHWCSAKGFIQCLPTTA